ncbi:MAG: DUF1801 domain-containing protein [Bacteroidetes bacterium]|nr:DUF1801 domain-containing protein [Bacteroidota bacterium]
MLTHNQANSADAYFDLGCGRCPLGGTPKCKVNTWRELLLSIRQLMRQTGLKEERKWGVPCYTDNGKNIVIIGAFKNYCSIAFFKGALMTDPYGLLQKPGENSQESRIIKLTSPDQLNENAGNILELIAQAIEIKRKGLKFPKNTTLPAIPAELQESFDQWPGFEMAFRNLSPGKQREYVYYFNQARQQSTRISRIGRSRSKIMSGKGLNEK